MGMLDGILNAVGVATTGIPWGSIITGGAQILGGIMGKEGQEDANRSNQEIAQNNSAFNAAQAQKQMDFQERMSNTAYQRGTKDMMEAGLNPMLAYSQGGASSPSGAAGSAVQPAEMRNAAGAGITAAAQVASVQNTQAQTRNLDADTDLKKADMKDPDAERNLGGDLPTKSFRASSEEARSRLLHNQVRNELEKISISQQQFELIKQEIKNAIAQERNIQANTRDTTANAVLRELAKNEAANASNSAEKYPGYGVNVKPFVGDFGKIINSAGTLHRMGK